MRGSVAGLSLSGALQETLLVLARVGTEHLVRGRESDDDDTGDDERKGCVDLPGLKDDAEVLGRPVEEHVHTAHSIVSSSVSSVSAIMASASFATAVTAAVSSVSAAVVHCRDIDEDMAWVGCGCGDVNKSERGQGSVEGRERVIRVVGNKGVNVSKNKESLSKLRPLLDQ